MAEDRDSGYQFSWEVPFQTDPAALDGFWVNVSGGGLPWDVALRFHPHKDGRYVFTGLVVSGALPDPPEITSKSLRHVRLADIQAALFGPDGPYPFDPTVPEGGSNPAAPGVARWLADQLAADGQASGGPVRGPSDDALRKFASTYRAARKSEPHRAMAAAAAAHNISRATANRWADRCRQLGYLPGKETP